MKRTYLYITLAVFTLLATRCNTNTPPANQTPANTPASVSSNKTDTVVMSAGSNLKGIGRFKDVVLTHPLDKAMIASGEAKYNSTCVACHKLTDEKLVGPGWKGVTDRRLPEWIMNFITNTQVMLDKDLAAQAEMVTCIVRMPNQNLTDDEARAILEFMRKNDGKN